MLVAPGLQKNRNLHSLFCFPFLNLAINTFPSINGTSFCKRTPNGHAFRMREISHCFDNFRIWSSCKKHQVHVQVDLLRIKLVILLKRQATVQSTLSRIETWTIKSKVTHSVPNLYFLSKNSTMIENCRFFFGVKNSWKCCGFGLLSCWQLWFGTL